jgi:tetratricopeptide (TPR) repeat protein
MGEESLFLSRNSEISRLISLINNGINKIALVGEGGIGKTSISIRVIRQTENSFDIIIPVNVTKDMKYRDFLLKVSEFVDAPFLNDLTEADLESLLAEILGSVGKVLVFVENYENVTDFIDTNPNEDLRGIHSFLETLPQNTLVILNSRNRSNLDGETAVSLDGLSKEDAKNLFIQMAKNYLPDSLSLEIHSKIEDICGIVDGHPLAIKLLGGAYRGGGVARLTEMCQELFSSIDNLRTINERHRSIKACFDYSYDRLSNNLKKMLLHLTLFKSCFMGDSAKEIFGIQESVLIDFFQRTLLQRLPIESRDGSEIFFYEFHPVIHEYLVQKTPANFSLTPYELKRYIKYYSKLIRVLFGSFFNDVSKNIKVVDLLTATEQNDVKEAISWIANEKERSVISNLLGLVLLQTGHKSRALYYHQLCYNIDRQLDDPDRVANDLVNIAASISEAAYSEEAFSIRTTLAKSFENAKEYKKAGRQHIGIGIMYDAKGDYGFSESSFREALSNFKKQNSEDRDIADALMNLTVALRRNTKYDEGIKFALEMVTLYEKLSDDLSLASAYCNLSLLYCKRDAKGDLDLALTCVSKARDIDRREKNVKGLIRDYRIMSEVYREKNNESDASECDRKAQEEIDNFEATTGEPYKDTGYFDYLERSDGSKPS